MKIEIAIVGSGPSALMAADVISSQGFQVSIFEKRKTPARKLLIAGSSGLNVTHDTPVEQLPEKYTGPSTFWKNVFNDFNKRDWLSFIHELGIKTFKGTSRRYFVEEMKAGNLLDRWKKRLSEKKVDWFFEHEVTDFKCHSSSVELKFKKEPKKSFQAVLFALGGASWEPVDDPITWPKFFIGKKIGFTPFVASNVGFKVDWSNSFLKEAEGLPLKNILLKTEKGAVQGDLVITQYGIEGTPIYSVGIEGQAHLDLKPELSIQEILTKLSRVKENKAPFRRIQKHLKLGPAALALLYHETHNKETMDLKGWVKRVKSFPLVLKERHGLERAISSAGGVQLHELDSRLMLNNFPGVFAAGEMLDWDTTTGGFLIQACVSQGYCAGKGVLNYLNNLRQEPKRKSGN